MEHNIILQSRSTYAANANRQTLNIKSPLAMGSPLDAPRTALGIAKRVMAYASAPVEWLRRYYSSVLERDVTTAQTLRYLHAQAAFALAVFPSYDSLLMHAAAVAWLVAAVAWAGK